MAAIALPPAPIPTGFTMIAGESEETPDREGWYGPRVPYGVKWPTGALSRRIALGRRIGETAHHYGVIIRSEPQRQAWCSVLKRSQRLAVNH